MSNRLIWLLIILVFILLWLGYYFWVEKPYQEKQEIIKNEIEVLNKKEIYKKVTLTKIEEKESESLLALNKEEKIELKNKEILKIKQNIWNILKINNIDEIKIQKISWDKNLFLINFDKKNYIFNKKRLNLKNTYLNIPIIYAKKINYKTYLITTKWTFILNNNNLEYFSMFSDFVFQEWNYIWIIKNTDDYIKNNFNLEKNDWNLIFLYNPKKSIKKVLYRPDFEIKKILLKNNKVIIESENNEFVLDY